MDVLQACVLAYCGMFPVFIKPAYGTSRGVWTDEDGNSVMKGKKRAVLQLQGTNGPNVRGAFCVICVCGETSARNHMSWSSVPV